MQTVIHNLLFVKHPYGQKKKNLLYILCEDTRQVYAETEGSSILLV